MVWSRRQRAVLLVCTLLFSLAMGGVIFWLTGSLVAAASILGLAAFVGLAVAVLTLGAGVARRLADRSLARRPLAQPGQRRYLVPRELPPPPVFFAGRNDVFHEAIARVRTGRDEAKRRAPFVLLIHGEPGVGKSGFAIKLATALLPEFPQGAVYASLTGAAFEDGHPNTRLQNVMGDLVDSLQGPGDTVPGGFIERQAEYRRLSQSRERRQILYVFDDVIDDAVAQALLPTGHDAVVLVTSRRALANLQEARVGLDPLTTADADHLLRDLLGNPDLDEAGDKALAKVVASAAGYPLALHLAARAITNHGLWTLPEVVADLPEPGHIRDVEVARARMLDLSVAMLTRTQRKALLALAMLPDATFVPWMVKAVAGLDDDGDEEAWIICERLADQRLLERISADASGVVRLRMPDRVRAYVTVRAAREIDADSRTAAARRLAAARERRASRDIESVLSRTIPDALNEGRIAIALDEARGALADVRERTGNVDGTKVPDELERRALGTLALVLAELGGLDDALEIATIDRKARAEARPPVDAPRDAADARLRRCLARLRRREWKLAEAARELNHALAIAQAVEDYDEQIWCLRELAMTESMLTESPDNHVAVAHRILDQARVLLDRSTNPAFLSGRLLEASAVIRINAFTSHGASQDELNEAIAELDRAAGELPPTFVLWRAWLDYQKARALHELAASPAFQLTDEARRRQVTRARRLAQQALVAFSNMSHRYGSARCRLEIGSMYAREGDPQAALPLLEEARETFFFCGDRWVEARTALVLAELRLNEGLDPAEAEAELDFALALFRAVNDTRHLSRALVQQSRLAQVTAPAVTA